MNKIPAICLLLIAFLGGCAAQPREPLTELVKLECARILNVKTNENGIQIRYWDTKCKEVSKELLPQQ